MELELLLAAFAVIAVALSKEVLLERILLDGVKLTAANNVATWELIEGGAKVEPEPMLLATPI